MTRHRAGSMLAIPSWAALGGLGVVVVALLGFFITGTPDQAERAAAAPAAPTAAPTTAAPTAAPTTAAEEVPRAYVEVFNNTRTSGLAARAADTVQDAGWKVVGTDNWNGNIPRTTVYYPERLEAQARLLASDVGIERLRPAVDPMKPDRLTVILTGGL